MCVCACAVEAGCAGHYIEGRSSVSFLFKACSFLIFLPLLDRAIRRQKGKVNLGTYHVEMLTYTVSLQDGG